MNQRPWILLIILVILQGSLFNRIHWLGLFNPMVYVITLIWLPTTWNRSILMLLGFGIGWWVDSSVQSGAIHAMASVWTIYFKNFWIRYTVSPVTLQETPDPDLRELEFRSLISYAGTLLFMHQTLAYSLEALRWNSLGSSLIKGSVNTVLVMGILWSLIQWTRSMSPSRFSKNKI